jgi:hypothetical protein
MIMEKETFRERSQFEDKSKVAKVGGGRRQERTAFSDSSLLERLQPLL